MPDLSMFNKDGVDYNLKDATAREEIAKLKQTGTGSGSGGNVEQSVSIFAGKTASFYGDSLTEENYHYTKGYHSWVKDLLGLASYKNYGVSGYTVSSVYNKVDSVNDTADIIFVMCGVNDQNFSVPLGVMSDNTTGTTYGSLNLLCAKLKAKYSTKLIVFITPHYQTKYPHSSGVTSYEVSKAIREVCEKYAIPVYDNFVLSGIYSTNLSAFTTDNCHWNDAAHEMVGKNLARFMVTTFQYFYGDTASGGGDTHIHSYTGTVTTAATCTTAGVKTFTCECGSSYTETIPATGHKWDSGVVSVQPTETTEGVKTYTCTVCGETRTETIPVTGHEHSYVSTVIAPTCTEQGYTEHVCSCGDNYRDSYVAATGHKWDTGTVTTAATCTTAGVKTFTCECGSSYTETIPATGHNYIDGVCSVCGASFVAVPAIINNSVDSAIYENNTLTMTGARQTFFGVTFPGASRMEITNIDPQHNLGWMFVGEEPNYKIVSVANDLAGEVYDTNSTITNFTNRRTQLFTAVSTCSSFVAEVIDGVTHISVNGTEFYSVDGTTLGYVRSNDKKATFTLVVE